MAEDLSHKSDKVAEFLRKNPNASFKEVAAATGAGKTIFFAVKKKLIAEGAIQKSPSQAAQKEHEKSVAADLALVTAPPGGSPLRESIVGHVTWWEEATQEVGKRLSMLALQMAGSSSDMEKTLSGFKSADEFVNWVTDVFHAFIDLKHDAAALLEEREKRRDAEARVAIRDMWVDALKQKLAETQAWFAYALKFVPKEEMMKMTLVSTAYSAVNNPILASFAQTSPAAQVAQAAPAAQAGTGQPGAGTATAKNDKGD